MDLMAKTEQNKTHTGKNKTWDTLSSQTGMYQE